jgi:hypothetical protein
MEGTRRPELQPFLHALQAAAMKSAGLILEAAGLAPSPEQVGELSRLLNGLVFSNFVPLLNRPLVGNDRRLDSGREAGVWCGLGARSVVKDVT